MKKYGYYTILSNKKLADGIFDMTILCPEIAKQSSAGQFVNVFLENEQHLLARPISICEIGNETIRLVYRAAGRGTGLISLLPEGGRVKLLAPLGNGFQISNESERIAVVGGGIGAPPLLELVKRTAEENPACEIHVFLGFRSEPFLIKDFVDTGAVVHISTDDGSTGFHGNVTQDLDRLGLEYDIMYSCGPYAMLKSVAGWSAERGVKLYVSLEERMACGIGACIGCAVKIKSGGDYVYKKVCSDGAVFDAEEVCFE